MSETKHTPLPWSAIRSTEDEPQLFDLIGGHPATTVVAQRVHANNIPFIKGAVNARPKVEQLLVTSKDIVASFRRCMEVTRSHKEYIDIRLAPAEKAIREVEAVLGGKTECHK